MKCPLCTETDLLMTERVGIEIDYCPNCRGIWLDRGELDKIVERSKQDLWSNQLPEDRGAAPARGASHSHHDHHGHGHDEHYRTRRHRKSFWQELFD